MQPFAEASAKPTRHPVAHVHLDPETGLWREHAMEAHLQGVAERAAAFAADFHNQDWAHLAGLLHDLGKFNPEFQAYLRLASGYAPETRQEGGAGKVDHSTAGAIHAVEQLGTLGHVIAYLIAGHHTGLPDWYPEPGMGGALVERLTKREGLDKALKAHPHPEYLPCSAPQSPPSVASPDHVHLWVRMLFSCLVDADFLDTEAFMQPAKPMARATTTALAPLKAAFERHMASFASAFPTPVNQMRQEVLLACREGAELPPGFFSLTVPTGGGKTLASLAFALDHALRHGKRRIIVVIPYTSIIEQTAGVLSGIFGPEAVLEHHCNLDPDRETMQGRLAAENWDSPIIVTTNVQFFESLFAARTSSCRKLHNIAQSVVIFDEAQMLPPEFLKPILSVLQGLVEGFGVSALLCTATQPAVLGSIGSQKARFDGLQDVRELMPDPARLAQSLQRVRVRPYTPGQEPVTWEALARDLADRPQVLCIVNTRKDCRALHALMPKGTLHLSGLMCAEHRSAVIQTIKDRLRGSGPVRVISTQLVEAGVDLDFPVVYRALAGLDSMAQAAGRCNREGRLNGQNQLGEVVLFAAPQPPPPGLLRKGEEAGKEMLRCFPQEVADLAPWAFRRYFELFYAKVNSFDTKDMGGLLMKGAPACYQFRTAASRFKLIDDQAQQAIVVWHGPDKRAIQALLEELRREGPSRQRLRKLQRFTVSLPERAFKVLQNTGDIQEIQGIWAQAVDGLYDDVLGLCPEGARWNPETYFC